MFERIKKWVARSPDSRPEQADLQAVEAWAMARELGFESLFNDGDFALTGQQAVWSWRLERTEPVRDFIQGAELRGRADVALPEDVAVMLINRPLKEDLEKRVYEQVTHSVQTTLDADLPEEARWLSLYDEVGWSTAPLEFWDRYAAVADTRAHAQQWLEGDLLPLLMAWPTPAVQQITPFILQLQRGRVYLRMEYPHNDVPTLEHALAVFTQACVSAQLLSADGVEPI
nr:hypothetical protein [uncultured Albidiferax sp.]